MHKHRRLAAAPLFLLVCAAAAAQIQPRMADAVQPRHAEPVRPRSPEVVARPAEPVSPRPTDTRADTAVVGAVRDWRWQSLADTTLGDGVGRGTRLANIRCAGVACQVFADSAGGWVIRAEGGFPRSAGQRLQVLLINAATQKPEVPERGRGVFSDGRFWDQVDTWQLPAGRYAVFYNDTASDRMLAAVRFDLERQAVASADGGRPAGQVGQAGQAAFQARELQRCLAMAATNPDIVCERK
jgi:hypothetical protein